MSTIRFRGELSGTRVALPEDARAELGRTVVEGALNGFPFRTSLEPDGCLPVGAALQRAAGAQAGDTVTVEITRAGDEPETRVPADLCEALAGAPKARASWQDITPVARRDWVLWVVSAKQPETRRRRIEKACDMLGSGKRRVCCFGGLKWLVKDHATVETWAPLPLY
ncbi:MAG: YdeI/OmpD-associated family protein [Candidatus Eremiobacterota bacterium]